MEEHVCERLALCNCSGDLCLHSLVRLGTTWREIIWVVWCFFDFWLCVVFCVVPPPPCWKAEGWFGNLIQVWRWTKPGAPKFCCRLSDMSVSVYICVYTTPPWATLELDTHSVAQGVGFSVAGVSPLLSRVTMDSLVLIGRLPHRDFSPNSRSSVRAGAGLICPWLVSNWS